jgi:hypothetical protein
MIPSATVISRVFQLVKLELNSHVLWNAEVKSPRICPGVDLDRSQLRPPCVRQL